MARFNDPEVEEELMRLVEKLTGKAPGSFQMTTVGSDLLVVRQLASFDVPGGGRLSFGVGTIE